MITPIKNINTKLNFKAYHKVEAEKTDVNKFGCLNHYTGFFRYDKERYGHSDEYLWRYLQNIAAKKPLNIVSIGCSYGEEPYSISMALDKYKERVNISAFDVSQLVIDEAKTGFYMLDDLEYEYLIKKIPDENMTTFRKEMRDSFQRNFEKIDNDAYQLKKGRLENCDFFTGDIREIDRIYPANSQDILLCRYVLYHLDSNEVLDVIKKMKKVLKPGGYLALNENEYRSYKKLLINAGFKQNTPKQPWLFMKPKKENILAKLRECLFSKADFNNIQ